MAIKNKDGFVNLYPCNNAIVYAIDSVFVYDISSGIEFDISWCMDSAIGNANGYADTVLVNDISVDIGYAIDHGYWPWNGPCHWHWNSFEF